MTTCDVLDFDTQMAIWGWAVVDTEPDLRRAVRNPVVIAERGQWHREGWWDREAADLAGVYVGDAGGYKGVPPWHALPAVADWIDGQHDGELPSRRGPRRA